MRSFSSDAKSNERLEGGALLSRFVELAPKEWECELQRFPFGPTVVFNGVPTILKYQLHALITYGTKDDDRASAEALIFLWDALEVKRGEPIVCGRSGGPVSKFTFDGGVSWGVTRIEGIVKAWVIELEGEVK